jgi:hypothetical protein
MLVCRVLPPQILLYRINVLPGSTSADTVIPGDGFTWQCVVQATYPQQPQENREVARPFICGGPSGVVDHGLYCDVGLLVVFMHVSFTPRCVCTGVRR